MSKPKPDRRARTLTKIAEIVTVGQPPPDAAQIWFSALSLAQLSKAVWAAAVPAGTPSSISRPVKADEPTEATRPKRP